MLDRIIASHAMYGRFRGLEIYNEPLGDEAIGYTKGVDKASLSHAAGVAMFTV